MMTFLLTNHFSNNAFDKQTNEAIKYLSYTN